MAKVYNLFEDEHGNVWGSIGSPAADVEVIEFFNDDAKRAYYEAVAKFAQERAAAAAAFSVEFLGE